MDSVLVMFCICVQPEKKWRTLKIAMMVTSLNQSDSDEDGTALVVETAMTTMRIEPP